MQATRGGQEKHAKENACGSILRCGCGRADMLGASLLLCIKVRSSSIALVAAHAAVPMPWRHWRPASVCQRRSRLSDEECDSQYSACRIERALVPTLSLLECRTEVTAVSLELEQALQSYKVRSIVRACCDFDNRARPAHSSLMNDFRPEYNQQQ